MAFIFSRKDCKNSRTSIKDLTPDKTLTLFEENFKSKSGNKSEGDKSQTLIKIVKSNKTKERKNSMDNSLLLIDKKKESVVNLAPKNSKVHNIPRPLPSGGGVQFEFNYNYTINQAEIGLRKFVFQNRNLFLNRLIKGPPESFRWVSWIISGNLDEERDEKNFLLYLDINIDIKTDLQIKKDLNRTMTNENMMLDDAKACLYNVLRAYAACDNEVSYCQGMNFITGFLLIVSDFNQVDCFYMLKYLFQSDSLNFRGFYSNEFPLLKLFIFQFDNIFEKRLSNLKNHFEDLEVPNELWISKWIQTIYTICLPIDLLVRLWDCILGKGLSFLFNFSLALLIKYEKELLKFTDICHLSNFFKDLSKKINNYDYEDIIKLALDINIPNTLLNDLRIDFEQKFNIYSSNKIEKFNEINDFTETSNQIFKKEISQIAKKSSIISNTSTKDSCNTLKNFKNDDKLIFRNVLYDPNCRNQPNNQKNKKISFSDLNFSKSSEAEIKENIMLVNKIKTHILEMKKKATVEESDIERISSLNNHKINIVKPFFERRVKLEEKNPFK